MDQKPAEKALAEKATSADEERRAQCEACWMGEYKETGFRYCMNPTCPHKPGARRR